MKSQHRPANQMECKCGCTAAQHDVKGSSRFPIWWACRVCDCKKFKSVAAMAHTEGEGK